MTNNSYPNIKAFIICVLSENAIFNSLKACRASFIFNALFYFSAIKGKINFLQLQRFSGRCEQYFRINFENKFKLSKNKLHFHFNTALTVVNLAKLHWLDTRKSANDPFFMANYKTLCHNTLLLNRFFDVFAINPNNPKIQNKIKELVNYGLIAA